MKQANTHMILWTDDQWYECEAKWIW